MNPLIDFDPILEHINVTRKGEVFNTKTNYKLKQFIRKSKQFEYLSISIYDKRRKYSRAFYTHRLVAYLYCKDYAENKIVKHIDGNTKNNKASNLEWKMKQMQLITIPKDTVKEVTHLDNGMTILPTEEWNRIKHYIKVLTDQIRYNNPHEKVI